VGRRRVRTTTDIIPTAKVEKQQKKRVNAKLKEKKKGGSSLQKQKNAKGPNRVEGKKRDSNKGRSNRTEVKNEEGELGGGAKRQKSRIRPKVCPCTGSL